MLIYKMRIRFKPWARHELEESGFYEQNPEQYIGNWKTKFRENNPLHIELGCGKGSFISNIALNNLNINYIAIDLVDAMLGLAKRNIEDNFNNNLQPIDNVILVRYDIERILNIFNKNDNIERIYINFCNPWPKNRHKKRRLTHSIQLEKYKKFLKNSGEIFFKTDDDNLFKESLTYFKECGFNIEYITYDLHSENIENNIITEHEKMFSDQGIKIKFLVAKKH